MKVQKISKIDLENEQDTKNSAHDFITNNDKFLLLGVEDAGEGKCMSTMFNCNMSELEICMLLEATLMQKLAELKKEFREMMQNVSVSA